MAEKIPGLHLHNEPDLFREATRHTAETTQFAARLIEKDYFCTLFLAQLLREWPGEMVFKGGTCLAKVYAGFYRLSEDLDFAVPVALDARRSQRSRKAADVKKAMAEAVKKLPVFHWVEQLSGRNDSKQYVGAIGYNSLLTDQLETIKLEVSFREPLLMPVSLLPAQTILVNPATGKAAALPVEVPCISQSEAMAEKFRAALTRRDVAIRDFYDIGCLTAKLGFNAADPEMLDLVRRKLRAPGNDAPDLGARRLAALRAQVDSALRPVLRVSDFAAFDLELAIAIVQTLLEATSRANE